MVSYFCSFLSLITNDPVKVQKLQTINQVRYAGEYNSMGPLSEKMLDFWKITLIIR